MFIEHIDSTGKSWYFQVNRELCHFVAWVLRRDRWGVERATRRYDDAKRFWNTNKHNLCYLDAVEQLKTFRQEAIDREQSELFDLTQVYGTDGDTYRAAASREKYVL